MEKLLEHANMVFLTVVVKVMGMVMMVYVSNINAQKKRMMNVVPYNPYLLLAWGGHVNVQKITRSGLERYLGKYISKVEPTFGLQVEYKNDVVKYLESRIIGAPEAVAIQLSHIIVDSNMQVIFIDTNFHEDRFRILMPANQIDEDDDGDEIFNLVIVNIT